MNTSRALVAAALVAAAFLLACGGDDESTPTATATSSATPAATESPVATGTPANTETPEATETPDATAEPTGAVDPDGPGDLADAPFDLDEIDNTETEGSALIADVRVASHEGYDRFVLEFSADVPDALTAAEAVPAYRVGYASEPIECGSGEPVDLEGAAMLEIHLPTSYVVDPDTGEPTVEALEITDDYQVIIEIEETCAFEGQSTWVLGITGPQPYRIFELREPARLVIDVATEDGS